jgi:release factor glutamine methyltransferase
LKLHERIAGARREMMAAGIPEHAAAFDAEILARHTLGWDRVTLLARTREPEPDDFPSRYAPFVARRVAREPVALILGRREFWGVEFEVTGDVLVPRPESEFIVEEALALTRGGFPVRTLMDIGTGSGCLATVLALELPDVRVIATDISGRALAIARRNAERHGVHQRIRFVQTDLVDGISTQADLVVSNPPYVPRDTGLQPEVRRFEPAEALYGGGDGFVIMRRLLATLPDRLAPGGRLVMEFGDGQEEGMREVAGALGWRILNVRNDLQDIARVSVLGRDR